MRDYPVLHGKKNGPGSYTVRRSYKVTLAEQRGYEEFCTINELPIEQGIDAITRFADRGDTEGTLLYVMREEPRDLFEWDNDATGFDLVLFGVEYRVEEVKPADEPEVPASNEPEVRYDITISLPAIWSRADCKSSAEWRELRERVLAYGEEELVDFLLGTFNNVSDLLESGTLEWKVSEGEG